MPWSDPLMAALQYKSFDSVHCILQSGANPNGPDDSFVTPLELATESDDFASIQSLVEHRADVNLPNRNGETSLHIAAYEDTSFESFELILNAGAEISIKDKSNKTALHLACSEFNHRKIKSILKFPNPPVNFQDDEGATPMHLLVYAHLDESILLEIIQIALKKGFDINSQTFHGETILQVGSQHLYSEMLLPDLLKLNNIDITLQDDSGHNFLHSFLTYRYSFDVSEEFLCNLLDGNIVSAIDVLVKIVNQQNDSGNTPLSIYITKGLMNTNAIKKFVSLVQNSNVKDNLGNSLLHTTVESAISTEDKIRTIKYLIGKGANVNDKDIFYRTPLFFAMNLRVVKLLIDNGADVNSVDRCKRTPLMALMSTGCPKICQYLINRGSHINHRDKYGSNALHYAAWENRTRELEVLIRCGINIDHRDKEGRTPLAIAYFWMCKEAAIILHEYTQKNRKATKVKSEHTCTIDEHSDMIWTHGNQCIGYPEYESVENLRQHFNIPEDVEQYVQHVLYLPGVGIPHVGNEAVWTESLVLSVVNNIAQQIGKIDERFKCSVIRTGSTFEDTKIDDPNEFDFVFQLDRFSNICTIDTIFEKEAHDQGFESLVSKDEDMPPSFSRYIQYDQSLICGRIRSDFYVLVHRVLTSKETWMYDEVFIDSKTIRNVVNKPIVNFTLQIIGVLYKTIHASIDIVPAIRIPLWWPVNSNSTISKVITQSTLQEGCLLLCQEPSEMLTLSETQCGVGTYFRVSCAPAEIKLIRTFPEWIRKSYAIAKLMKGNILCPKLKFGRSQPKSDEHSGFQRYKLVQCESVISSYMLKNCLFHIVHSEPSMLQVLPHSGKSYYYNSVALALTIFSYLGKASAEKQLPVYFLPYLNLFEKEETEISEEIGVTLSSFCDDEFHDEFRIIKIFCDFITKLYTLHDLNVGHD